MKTVKKAVKTAKQIDEKTQSKVIGGAKVTAKKPAVAAHGHFAVA